MRKITPLQLTNFYHIYNRGNNGENLFYSDENYLQFLRLHERYIPQIAKTYARCLLKNHFHLLVEIRNKEELKVLFSEKAQKLIAKPSQPFSNLFNAYVQAINKQNNRHGSLLETPFRRKHIKDEKYLKNLILYIQKNPIHHRFTEKSEDYEWSSYQTIISDKKSLIEKEKVIESFDNKENFVFLHQQKIDVLSIEKSIF